jgi:hypothetical protein
VTKVAIAPTPKYSLKLEWLLLSVITPIIFHRADPRVRAQSRSQRFTGSFHSGFSLDIAAHDTSALLRWSAEELALAGSDKNLRGGALEMSSLECASYSLPLSAW